ncbi:MAG: hypothetical protein A2Y67_00030 [Candidatus Buchananbacteria bacterium RBG_13_39_9]|uniref:Uncharacterized protein n=1 Tax=Candidatus Buchananbacteria bacterium RBG_13_39_9 TaxID=1797531 RepID=A0A1G1XN45_9BACT|nr:MAG: hypothetical protein A2Y67_00030 [Candidatus Buchananbacteria bacterium RBG_13_39_9]
MPAIMGGIIGIIVWAGIILLFPKETNRRQRLGAALLGAAFGSLITALSTIITYLEYLSK